MESVQRSLEWHEQRNGRFTASEIHKLMGVRGLGDTGKSYAIDKAIEELFGEVDENFISYDMERGIELEPLAFAKFKELKELEFMQVQNCGFFNYCENSGASPDGLVAGNAILEIKCPKASTFFKLVATNEIDQKYFYQMQMQMMSTGRSRGYFFNYIIIDGQELWHTIEVESDFDIWSKMQNRLAEAIEIKNEFINKLKSNQQWN
ncbi:MAG: YqaJ viral recombinase family protein [Flavobacterium sp.]|nr:YqaJ viral recombinase family protein [Flavobacterium sp.]